MYIIFFIHSSVNRHLGFFHVLAIVNSTAMNTVVNVSFQIMVFSRYMPRSGIACTYHSSTVRFFKKTSILFSIVVIPIFLSLFFSCLYRAAPMHIGDSQARDLIGAVAAGLCQSHSNAGSKLCLQPTPQLTPMLDP